MSKSRSLGVKLKVGEKNSDTLTVIGGLTSIEGIQASAETVDLTSMDNESGYREKEPGFKDGGEVSVSGFFNNEDAGQQKMYELFQSGDVVPVVIEFPPKQAGAKWEFNAGVSEFSTSFDLEDGVGFEATFLVSGKPTLTFSQVSAG